MAESKAIHLTLGVGGRVIGSATFAENGIIMAEIYNETVYRELFETENTTLSIQGEEQ